MKCVRNKFSIMLKFLLLLCVSGMLLLVQFPVVESTVLTDAGELVPIHVITLTVGDNPLYGRTTTELAFNAGFSNAKNMYPRVFENFKLSNYYVPGNFSCLDAGDQMTNLIGQMFKQQMDQERSSSATIILTPGCQFELSVVGDFARETETTVLASTSIDRQFGDETRYPTIVSMGSSTYETGTFAVIAVLRNIFETRVTIICNKYSEDDTFSDWMNLTCTSAIGILSAVKPSISLLPISVSSRSDGGDEHRRALHRAKQHGPVLILLCLPELQKLLMAKAVDLELHKHFFVFFIFRMAEFPLYRKIWISGDDFSQKATMLLPRCIEVGDAAGIINNRTETFQVELNGHNYTASPEFKVAAYETVIALAQVLNESYGELRTLGTGREFAKLFHNRSFNILNEVIAMSPSGMRLNNVILSLYNSTAKQFEKTWYFDAKTRTLQPLLNFGNVLHERFGFTDAEKTETESTESRHNYSTDQRLLGLVSIIFIVIAAVAVAVTCRYKKIAHKRENSWWFIDDSELNYEVGTTTNSNIYIAGYRVNQLITSGDSDKPIMEEVLYKDQIVEFVRFEAFMDLNTMLKRKKTLATLRLLRTLDHPNITKFYGLAIHKYVGGEQLMIVVESPKKGLLRNMIDDDSLVFNWDLRFSLIWDIIKGLRFLHSTPMQCHGFLCFVQFIIDQHFTLKIAHTGLTQLFSSFFDEEIAFPIPLFLFLWFAPEVINDVLKGQTKPSDMYSLGIMLYEMVTRNTPFNVDVTNISEVTHMVDHIKSGKLDVEAYPMPDVSPILCKTIKQCWSPDPAKRPTIANISDTLVRVHPNNNLNFTDNLIARLRDYNEELETAVGMRTEALLQETEKVDQLLGTILPSSVVVKLRNKVEIVPEYFESVTLLFSAIPIFNQIVTACSPFAVVEMLQSLYSTMDELITHFDVYKVETVKDTYMVASGLPERNGNQHGSEIARLSLRMLGQVGSVLNPIAYRAEPLKLQIGISTGPVMAAIIGQKLPRYCLVGDTVNTTSRMESYGQESKIHLSLSTKDLLDMTGSFIIEPRGKINVKGKGEIFTFWLLKNTALISGDHV